MWCVRAFRGMWAGLFLAALAAAPVVRAQSAESKFHRAYFLEHARGEIAAAAQAYDEVAADRSADTALRAEARTRRQACHEELASADFAKLMPPNALVYAELNRPGEQLSRLLKMLGLLGEDGSVAADPERCFAISPALVRELLGIRGAAVAVTGFDPAHEMPTGVAVLHPGDIQVIRGLIETALPAGAQLVDPIDGFPTYQVEGQVFVTLTARLIVVSPQRHEVEGVIARLGGQESESLADNAELAEVMRKRDDSLLFFCVNFKPALPLLKAAMAAGGTQSRELAVAQALLDLDSLRTLVGRMGVSDQGLYLDVTLTLDQAHRNLLFQFLRMPAIDPETLRRIPSGAAGFFAGALNEAGQRGPVRSVGTGELPPVTMLDIGREIFANIVSVAVFAVPTGGEVPAGQPPIPPVAAVITVKDPVRSQALWNQALGVASVASAGGPLDGLRTEIGGVSVRRYTFPDGVSIYLAVVGHDLLVSPNKAALARSLATLRGGKSIVEDPAFAKSLGRLGSDATFALFAHPGRCAQLAQAFMSPGEVQEMQPVVELMTDTVASVVMEHSDDTFRFSAMVTGLPDVGPLVSKMIMQERKQAGQANIGEQLWKEFKVLAVEKGEHEAALTVAQKLFEVLQDDATRLNNCAWALLTEEPFGGRFNELALKLSRRSNELTDHNNWAFVDTLALALFETGDVQGAVELEKKALTLCGNGPAREEVEAALERFQAAVEE